MRAKKTAVRLNVKEVRKQLESALRAEEERLRRGKATATIHGEAIRPHNLDDASLVAEQGTVTAMLCRESARIRDLQAALWRLDHDRYGLCANCGEQIAPARLHAVPEAPCCVECQVRDERAARQNGGSREHYAPTRVHPG